MLSSHRCAFGRAGIWLWMVGFKEVIDIATGKIILNIVQNCGMISEKRFGKNDDVRVGVLIRICEVLDCNIDDIIEYSTIENRSSLNEQ